MRMGPIYENGFCRPKGATVTIHPALGAATAARAAVSQKRAYQLVASCFLR